MGMRQASGCGGESWAAARDEESGIDAAMRRAAAAGEVDTRDEIGRAHV